MLKDVMSNSRVERRAKRKGFGIVADDMQVQSTEYRVHVPSSLCTDSILVYDTFNH